MRESWRFGLPCAREVGRLRIGPTTYVVLFEFVFRPLWEKEPRTTPQANDTLVEEHKHQAQHTRPARTLRREQACGAQTGSDTDRGLSERTGSESEAGGGDVELLPGLRAGVVSRFKTSGRRIRSHIGAAPFGTHKPSLGRERVMLARESVAASELPALVRGCSEGPVPS